MNLIKTFVRNMSHGKKAWFIDHVNDQYVKKAQQHNFRSRASFKLLEIQQRYAVISRANTVLDLGAAPGSWSQAVKTLNPATKVAAVDLLYMAELDGVDFYQSDARSKLLHKILMERYTNFGVVISDMAPNFSETLQLNKCCLSLSLSLGTEACNLVMKTIQGDYQKYFVWLLECFFKEVIRFKPKASRSQSTQHYLVCKEMKAKSNKQLCIGNLQRLDMSIIRSKKQLSSLFDEKQ